MSLPEEEGRELAADLVQIIEKWTSSLTEHWEPTAEEAISTIHRQIQSQIARFTIFWLRRELASSPSGRGVFEAAWDHIHIRLELLSVDASKQPRYARGVVGTKPSAESELARNLQKYIRTKALTQLLITAQEIRDDIHEMVAAYLEFTDSLRRPGSVSDHNRHEFSPDGPIIVLPLRRSH